MTLRNKKNFSQNETSSVENIENGAQENREAIGSYIAPRIITHSAEELHNDTNSVDACTSFVP